MPRGPMVTASHGCQLLSQGPHPPRSSVQGETSLRAAHHLLPPWGAEVHPDKGELIRHTGRGILTRIQQLGCRALVPQASSPSFCFSRSVM